MRMNLTQFSDMLARGELPEEYVKRTRRLNKLVQERDFLEDAIAILTPEDRNYIKKKTRLDRVLKLIEELR